MTRKLVVLLGVGLLVLAGGCKGDSKGSEDSAVATTTTVTTEPVDVGMRSSEFMRPAVAELSALGDASEAYRVLPASDLVNRSIAASKVADAAHVLLLKLGPVPTITDAPVEVQAFVDSVSRFESAARAASGCATLSEECVNVTAGMTSAATSFTAALSALTAVLS